MKIVCAREPFLAAFQTAASVALSRSPKAILQHVKLTATPEKATFTATDLEVGVRVESEGVEVETPGAAMFHKDRFGDLLRESRDEKLVIHTEANGMTVRGERSEFHLAVAGAEEFPEVAAFDSEAYVETPARLFRTLIHRTLYATDPESSRYALGGVKLENDKSNLVAVGTDGRRLAKMEGPCVCKDYEIPPDASVIVPVPAMSLIERALGEGEGEIRFHATGNDIRVRGPNFTVYARLVEGRFPKWRDVFPRREGVERIDLMVGQLLTAVRQAAVVASEESRGVKFHFRTGELLLSAATAEVGDSSVRVPLSYEGRDIPIALDHRFVTDFLRTLSDEATFTIEIENSDAAAVLKTDDGYGYVVMPLSLER